MSVFLRTSELVVRAGAAALFACTALAAHAAPLDTDALLARSEAALLAADARSAEPLLERGLVDAREDTRDRDIARLSTALCRLRESLSKYDLALAAANEARSIAAALQDSRLEADAASCASLVRRRLGDYRGASAEAERALALATRVGDLKVAAESLRNMAAALQALGDYRGARPLFERALQTAKAAGDELEQARAENDYGTLDRVEARYEDAIGHFERSLELREKLGDKVGQARVIGNLCLTRLNTNQLDLALGGCEDALKRARDIGDRSLEARMLTNVAAVRRARGELKEALALYRQSLDMKIQLGDVGGAARTRSNLGELAMLAGDFAAARKLYEDSLAAKDRIGDREGIAATRFNLATMAMRQGDLDEARRQLQTTLALEVGQPEVLWRTFDGLARVYDRKGNRDLAIFFGKLTVREIQRVRASLGSMDEDVKRAFLEDKARTYRQLANWLIEAGRLPEAQQVLDMLKQEDYYDFIHRELRRTTDADPRKTSPALSTDEATPDARYRELTTNLAVKADEYWALRAKRSSGRLSEAETARLQLLEQELAQANAAFAQWLRDTEDAFAKTGRNKDFAERDFDSLHKLQGELGKVPSPAALVYYLVNPESVEIIVAGRDTKVPPVHRTSRIAATKLNTMVFDYVRAIEARASAQAQAKALYDVLIAPIAADLDDLKAGTLMVSLDGALRYLPLSALHDGHRYLIERFALVVYTPAANIGLTAPDVKEWRVAGLGTGTAAESLSLSALPSVSYELHHIVKESDTDAEGILPGKLYLDGDFTFEHFEDVADAAKLSGTAFPIIHVASHFVFRPGTENDSFLLLGAGQRFPLARLRDMSFDGVQLLTLSACQTAVSGPGGDGREIEGFAALAQERGARSVIATLWSVADLSTATLMIDFYRQLRAGGKTKAEALRLAQLALMRGASADPAASPDRRGEVIDFSQPTGETTSSGPSYANPFYWAPFILIGNWL